MSAKGNRRAKILQGRVDPERTAGNAYVVFVSADSVEGALSANMHEVRTRWQGERNGSSSWMMKGGPQITHDFMYHTGTAHPSL